MDKKIIVAFLVLAGIGLFGCLGFGEQNVALGAADGDFKSLNVRGGPTVISGTMTVTGNTTFTGTNTITGYINSTPGAGTVNSTALASNAVITAKIADANVTDGKLALNYAQTAADSRVQSFTGTLPNGSTSTVITFGTAFGGTPTVAFSLTSAPALTNSTFYVSAANATTVTITANQALATNVTFSGIALGAS